MFIDYWQAGAAGGDWDLVKSFLAREAFFPLCVATLRLLCRDDPSNFFYQMEEDL